MILCMAASGGAPEAATPAFTAPAPVQDRTTIGVAVLRGPRYQGSDRYRLLAVPVIELRYGRFFANPRKGIGYQVLRHKKLTITTAATYVRGYRQEDTPKGVGRLASGVGARVAADLKSHGVRATLGVTKVLSGDVDGTLVDAGLSATVPVSRRLALMPGVSATWASRSYTERYFGLTPVQAAASGLRVFQPGGGIKDVSATLAAVYRLDDHVSVAATGALTSVQGDAKDSPIVLERTQSSAVLSVMYRF